jgi:hypothetical protein
MIRKCSCSPLRNGLMALSTALLAVSNGLNVAEKHTPVRLVSVFLLALLCLVFVCRAWRAGRS